MPKYSCVAVLHRSHSNTSPVNNKKRRRCYKNNGREPRSSCARFATYKFTRKCKGRLFTNHHIKHSLYMRTKWTDTVYCRTYSYRKCLTRRCLEMHIATTHRVRSQEYRGTVYSYSSRLFGSYAKDTKNEGEERTKLRPCGGIGSVSIFQGPCCIPLFQVLEHPRQKTNQHHTASHKTSCLAMLSR